MFSKITAFLQQAEVEPESQNLWIETKQVVMFSKITAFLQQAAEVTSQVLAPQLNRHEEFQGHWKYITNTLTEDNASSDTVESTGITGHLELMVELLCAEEEERNPLDPGTMGPCLEYVLRHKLLNTLVTTAKDDYPAGMCRQVLLFCTMLFGRIERPLLHNVTIHQPIQKLVAFCGSLAMSKIAKDEVQFLKTLCLCLQKDPRLADFFILEDSGRRTFLVSESLLKLVNSEDSLVVMKSYECLLTCVSLQHTTVSEAMASSQLPLLLASKLQYHFQLIPSSTPHSTIIQCHAGWGVDYAIRGHTVDHSPSTHGHWHMEAFLSWLDYCEQVVGVAQPQLADALCDSITEVLLTASLLPKLVKLAEEDILLTTSVLTRAIQAVSCRRFLQEFVSFTLHYKDVGGSLSAKLIERINHLSDDVCQVTLQLFDVLFNAPLYSVVHDLILVHWSNQIDQPSLITPLEDIAVERSQLEESIKEYLSLVPEDLTSCKHVAGDLGLEQYLVDAHQQVDRCRSMIRSWDNGTGDGGTTAERGSQEESPLPPPTAAGERGESAVCEGPLLSALLNKTETLLDQPYESNLLLTSILTSIIAVPHPMVDWLCATTVPTNCPRNLYSTLKKVSSELETHAERTPGIAVSIIEARRRLAGQMTSDLLSMPHNDLLEGAIILEEFSKEIGTVLFAKKSTSMLSLPSPHLN